MDLEGVLIMPMTKQEFKTRWESDDLGGGITFDDVAECYQNWGLGTFPRTKDTHQVLLAVLRAAQANDAESYAGNP